MSIMKDLAWLPNIVLAKQALVCYTVRVVNFN
jgi:hypothetical protein